jgi:cation:H+ antiporter
VAGLAVLVVAGDALVKGAVALSLRLGIPVVIVGLTVVAFGTSAPELLVSVQAALDGVPGIAVGNVVGSNIANVLLVLGLPALIAVIRPSGDGSRRSFAQMIGATLVLIALAFAGPLGLWHAAVLLGLFALMLSDAYVAARSGRVDVSGDVDSSAVGLPGWRVALLLVGGLVGLPLGAQLLIDGAVGLSRAFGVSEEVIGLTLVALGTSLPELAATFAAARRRETDVVLGNVIGSNLFNILLILGVTSLFGPVRIDPAFLARDLWVMLATSLMLAPFVYRNIRIGRRVGIAFLLLYVGYIVVLYQNGAAA